MTYPWFGAKLNRRTDQALWITDDMNNRAAARLFTLCGPTVVGKGTVVGSLYECYLSQLYLSVSTTTCQPCPDEVEGKPYFFVSREELQGLIDSGGILEWAEVHQQNFYGTPVKPVDEVLARGLSVLLEIDLNGFRQAKAVRPEAYLIFLLPPSREELKRRLIGCGTESTEEQHRRLETIRVELAAQNEFDELIVSGNLAGAVSALAKFMRLA